MRGIGKTTSSMERALKLGRMERAMKVTMWKARKTESASSHGLMDPPIMDSLLITISMEKVCTVGQTVVSTVVYGRTTRWRVVVCLPGLTIGGTKVSTSMIRKRGTESSTGQMDASMKETGKTANNMESDFIHQLMGNQERVNGLRARECSGSNDCPETFQTFSISLSHFFK